MPRYEIVAHIRVEFDDVPPDEAAALFKRELAGCADGAMSLRNLAVWRPDGDGGPTPLPSPLPRHLEAFFAGVTRAAAVEEELFRRRVEEIFAADAPGASEAEDDGRSDALWANSRGGAGSASADWQGTSDPNARARVESEEPK